MKDETETEFERLWTDRDCDEFANVPDGTHRKLACTGEGPPSLTIGKRRRRYVPAQVRAFYQPKTEGQSDAA